MSNLYELKENYKKIKDMLYEEEINGMTFDSYIVVLRNVSIKKVTNQTVRGLK